MRKLILTALILTGLISATFAQAPSQPKDYTIHVVGYAHMDMAWLWRGRIHPRHYV
jgi:alpha-mannosidase